MMQLILPGFETLFGLNHSEDIIFDPEAALIHFQRKGYSFLSDWNSGKLLVRNNDPSPYIPERIFMPSGRILDEIELLDELEETKIGSRERGELEGAFYYFHAIHHMDIHEDYRFQVPSFISETDQQTVTEKYRKNPFFLDVRPAA